MGCAEPEVLDLRIGSRDAARVRVLAPVEAVCSDGTVVVVAHDLCMSGMRIETRVQRFQSGDVIRIRLPFLPVEQLGEIAWTHGAILAKGGAVAAVLDHRSPARQQSSLAGRHPAAARRAGASWLAGA